MREVVEQIIGYLKEHEQTLALAESCTGGQLSVELTQVPGVSQVYKGAVVSYAGSVKESLLGVNHETLLQFGEVSEPTAEQMALGAQEKLQSDWALSVTGIAGPAGGTREKPVGTVCFGLAGPGFVTTNTKRFDLQDRATIQRASVEESLNLLLKAFQK